MVHRSIPRWKGFRIGTGEKAVIIPASIVQAVADAEGKAWYYTDTAGKSVSFGIPQGRAREFRRQRAFSSSGLSMR